MKTKLTPHKIAQVDRLLAGCAREISINSHHRIRARLNQGATFGHNAESQRNHGYIAAWLEAVAHNLQTV